MAKREPVSRDEAEDKERSQHKKTGHSENAHFKSPDEGVTGSLSESSFEGHSAMLAGARSDKQRANLVMLLQQSHGNAYVQRLLSSRLVQAKLTVNPPDDQYEKEADRVADKVMQVQTPDVQRQMEEEEEPLQPKVSDIQRGAMPGEEEEEEIEAEVVMGAPGPAPAAPPAPAAGPPPPAPAPPAPAPERRGIPAPPGASGGGFEEAMGAFEAEEEEEAEEEALGLKRSNDIQRQPEEEEEEPIQPKASDIQRQVEPEEEEEEEETVQAKAFDIQRQAEPEEEEEEEPVQAKASKQSALEVSDNLEQRIEAARGGGQPLQESTRDSLEPQLSHDFDNVRIHNDGEADKLSRQLGADAFTTGRDVFFKEGTYNPESDRGQGLIAHELTHVVQQSAVPEIQRASVTEKETKGAELGGGKAVDEARLAALKTMFEVAVAGQLREGYKALSGEKPDAKQAYTNVRGAYDVVKALLPSYHGVEPIYSRLVALGNAILTIGDMLEPHIGITRPLSEIGENLNPDGAVMGGYMEAIKSQL